MTTLMQRGIAWVGDRLRTAAGRSVTYRRGLQSIALTAIGVRHSRAVQGADNLQTVFTTYEWQVKAADLVISETTFEPRIGDMIIEVSGSVTAKYQVLDLDETTPCYEFLDEAGTELIIHTKRVRA